MGLLSIGALIRSEVSGYNVKIKSQMWDYGGLCVHVSAVAAVLSQQWQPGSLPGLSAGLVPFRTAALILYQFKTDKSRQQEQSAVCIPDISLTQKCQF